MTPRVAITNIGQFADLARENNALLNIPAFSPLREAVLRPTPTTGCKCKRNAHLANYRVQFEAAMALLTESDKELMKKLLNTEKICYYYRNSTGKLTQVCF